MQAASFKQPGSIRLPRYVAASIYLGVLLAAQALFSPSSEAAQPTPAAIAEWTETFGFWGPLLLGSLVALESLIAPIPGWFLTAGAGLLYGFWLGLTLTWIGAMVGSVLAFWLARRYGRRFIAQRVPAAVMARFDHVSEHNGFLILLIARVVPFTALDILSYAAGLSHMRFLPFCLATGLGLLPGMVALVATGSEVASILRLDYLLYIALGALAVVGIVGRIWRQRHNPSHERS